MATLAEFANATAATKGSLTGAAAVRHAGLQPLAIYATMQGQRTVMNDQIVWSGISTTMIRSILWEFGGALARIAQFIHAPNIDTQETYDSIRVYSFVNLPGGAKVEVAVGTPQAKFLEFGFVHHLSGAWIQNPFMLPAADIVVPVLIDAIQQVAGIASGRRHFTGAAAATTGATATLAGARAALYSYSKFAGDIQVLGFPGLSKSRGLALKGARGLGNIQAAQSGTLVSRAGRVLVGQKLGRFGRAGVVSGFQPGAVGGPVGRIYNRVAGKIFGGVLSDINVGEI